MKKIALFAVLAFFAIVNLQAQDDLIVVSGKWNRPGVKELSLFSVRSGRLQKVASYYLQNDQSFSFAFAAMQENYYVIGTGGTSERNGKYTFYLKPGDHLNIAVNDTSYTLIGENTNENIAMNAWHDYIQPLEYHAYYRNNQNWTYVEYFPVLDEKTERPYSAESTGNAVFDESFAKFRKFDLMNCALQFVMTPRSAHPEGEDFSDYYRNIKIADLSANSDILMYPYRILQLASYIEGRLGGQKISTPEELIDAAIDETVKAELYLSYLSEIRDFTKMQNLKTAYDQYIKTEDQKIRLDAEKERITKFMLERGVGKPALNFTYKDVNGKSVSLSDFKGKVVYVDVWATWCGPCRREIPHLKALEEKFHGNGNIVFIGVSSDGIKDIQKWKDFVAKEQLPGIQLHGRTTGDDDILKLYKIEGIPRFLLFDQKGNIVSVDAPNPSSKEIVPLLNSLLK